MNVVALEFDKIRYPDIKSCEEWLKGTRELETILQIRGFRLRINKKCHYLTHEPRAVYSYYSGTWKYPQLMIERPNPHVVVVKASADTQPFVDADLPELLPETIAKQATRREKEVRRREKELKRREARKAQRRAAAGKKQNQRKRKEKHDSDEIEEGQRKKNNPCYATDEAKDANQSPSSHNQSPSFHDLGRNEDTKLIFDSSSEQDLEVRVEKVTRSVEQGHTSRPAPSVPVSSLFSIYISKP